MTELDMRFAGLWLGAYDAAAPATGPPQGVGTAVLEPARGGLLPIQFALAGMNTHIEHDLALAVVAPARRAAPTRTTRRCWPTT